MPASTRKQAQGELRRRHVGHSHRVVWFQILRNPRYCRKAGLAGKDPLAWAHQFAGIWSRTTHALDLSSYHFAPEVAAEAASKEKPRPGGAEVGLLQVDADVERAENALI